MKKLLSFALSMCMLLSLAACGGKQGGPSASQSGNPSGPDASSAGQSAGPAAVTAADFFSKGKTITMIIGWSAGSSNDNILQQWIKVASKYVDASIITDYQVGGSGMVANQYMLSKPNDGYYAHLSSITNEISMSTNGFSSDSYEVLASLLMNPGYITVRADSDFYTMQDIIDYAKANPGKLNWGGANAISIHSFFFNMLSAVAGVEMNYIPYDSTAEVITGILGNNTQVAAGTNAILAYVDSGDLRLIASGTYDRSPATPDCPAVYETPGLEASNFETDYTGSTSIMVRSGLSQEAKDAWADLLTKVSEDEEWIEWAELQGFQPRTDFVLGEAATASSRARVDTYAAIYDKYYD